MDTAVVIVVAEMPVGRVDGAVASPAVVPLTVVHTALVVGSELVVLGVVSPLLPGTPCPLPPSGTGWAPATPRADVDEGGAVGAPPLHPTRTSPPVHVGCPTR